MIDIMDSQTCSLNAFLYIPILVMGSIKILSFMCMKYSRTILNSILSMLSLIVNITALVLVICWPDLKLGGNSVPCFYLPLGLSTVFPGIFEVMLLQNLMSQWGATLLWTYISLSTIGKILFSLCIILPHSWPYELLTFFIAFDYLFLAGICFLITRRTSPNGPSHVVLVRRASDFIGLGICASIFGALGIRQRLIWAALNEVLMMLATAFITHAQPVVKCLPKKQDLENDEMPCIQVDSRSHETT